MPKKLQLAGVRFGKLLVLREDGQDAFGAFRWKCRCNCGSESTVRGSELKRGITQSCGCGIGDAASKPKTHGQTGTPIYRRWHSMIERCRNQNSTEYRNYGGRGIIVCGRWKRFEDFSADMAPTFSEELELDRIDVNGNYEPGNCRWISRRQQQYNKRTNHRITWRGQTLTISEWASSLGVSPSTIAHRLKRGWSIERALSKGARLLELANAEAPK